MSLIDGARDLLRNFLRLDELTDTVRIARLTQYQRLDDYYQGMHKRQLKVKPNQADDNLAMNFVGLAVERGISMMLKGVKFEAPVAATQAFLDEVWEANRKRILLHKACQNASVFGTGYLKMVPEGVESKQTEDKLMTRVVALDPRWMEIETEPEDVDTVRAYVMRYNVVEGKDEIARKEVIRRVGAEEEASGWVIEEWRADQATSGKWTLTSSQAWEYEFPPIVHWQNLPQAGDCYGQSDVEDIIELQDRVNFLASNISRIIRYHAHPKTWGRGVGATKDIDWGPDKVVWLPGDNSNVSNLEMQSDLASSRAFYADLRQALFDISRTVDISSIKDRVGALTNFGLRVLYIDVLDKLDTKRELFGEALLELEQRMMKLEGMEGKPGLVTWGDPLPVDETGAAQSDGFELDNQLVSKQTISKRRGYDWEKEQELMEEEKASEGTVGSMILKAFGQGEPTANSQPGSPIPATGTIPATGREELPAGGIGRSR
jgi:hypothetical protein